MNYQPPSLDQDSLFSGWIQECLLRAATTGYPAVFRTFEDYLVEFEPDATVPYFSPSWGLFEPSDQAYRAERTWHNAYTDYINAWITSYFSGSPFDPPSAPPFVVFASPSQYPFFWHLNPFIDLLPNNPLAYPLVFFQQENPLEVFPSADSAYFLTSLPAQAQDFFEISLLQSNVKCCIGFRTEVIIDRTLPVERLDLYFNGKLWLGSQKLRLTLYFAHVSGFHVKQYIDGELVNQFPLVTHRHSVSLSSGNMGQVSPLDGSDLLRYPFEQYAFDFLIFLQSISEIQLDIVLFPIYLPFIPLFFPLVLDMAQFNDVEKAQIMALVAKATQCCDFYLLHTKDAQYQISELSTLVQVFQDGFADIANSVDNFQEAVTGVPANRTTLVNYAQEIVTDSVNGGMIFNVDSPMPGGGS